MTAPVTGSQPRSQWPQADGGTPGEYWTTAGTVRGPLPKQETEALAEREQATVADPVPLGLAGFASATFTISSVFAGWFGLKAVLVAIPVALIYGGIGQFLAGMWAFRRGNVIAATAFGSFGAFNASWALLQILAAAHIVPAMTVASGPAYVEGIFVLTFALIAAYLAVAALGDNLMIAAILAVLAFTYLCDGTGVWIGGHNWLLGIGGYAGMLVSLMAFFLSAVMVINSGMRRAVLPSFGVHR